MTETKGGPGKALEKLAPSPGAAIVPAELDALAQEYAGAGADDMTQADRTTPFLGLVQGLSPQIDKQHAKYIKGAEVGDVFNTVTGEFYKPEEGGVRVVPVLFQKVWTVWVPRDQGGGFLGTYADPGLSRPVFVPPGVGEGYDGPTQVVETAQHFVLVEGKDGTWAPAVVPMKVTQLKASRHWNTLVTMAQNKYATARGPAPVFLRVYRLTSVQQTNEKGTFANYRVEDLGFSTAPLIRMAAELRAAIQAGFVKADYSKSAEADEQTAGGGDAPGGEY